MTYLPSIECGEEDGNNITLLMSKRPGQPQEQKISWPSGLRRYVKAVVFTGVGSNPTEVTFLLLCLPILSGWRYRRDDGD